MAATMRTGSRSWSVRSAALVLALTAVACGGGSKDEAASSTSTSATTPPVTRQIAGVNAVLRGTSVAADGLEVDINDNYFAPNVITGTAGQVVTLTLKSAGKALHNFSLTEQSISQDVQPGATTSVKVMLPSSGSIAFFCKYHRDEAGMVGSLEVSQ